MALPLDGVNVLEFAEAGTGPLSGMMLADMGAEVVKIEKPGGGDVLRNYEPKKDGLAGYYLWVNRNKRTITLDVKSDRGRELFLELAADADIVIENHTPGVVGKLGVDYEDVTEVNPEVIYCHISGFGQSGPYSDRKAIDQVMQGEAGVMSVTGYPNKPAKTGFVYTDITTGMYSAFSLLSAYLYRERTGKGQEIDMAMWDVQLLNLGLHGYRYLLNEELSERMGTKYPSVVPYQAFKTADDEFINVCVINETQWTQYCEEVIERPDLTDDPRFETNYERVKNRDVLEPILEEEMKQRTLEEFMDRFVEQGIPAAPVNDVGDVIEHPQTDYREMILSVDHSQLDEIDLIGFPGEFSELDQRVRTAPPTYGQHTDDILEELGLSEDEIESLYSDGVTE